MSRVAVCETYSSKEQCKKWRDHHPSQKGREEREWRYFLVFLLVFCSHLRFFFFTFLRNLVAAIYSFLFLSCPYSITSGPFTVTLTNAGNIQGLHNLSCDSLELHFKSKKKYSEFVHLCKVNIVHYLWPQLLTLPCKKEASSPRPAKKVREKFAGSPAWRISDIELHQTDYL